MPRLIILILSISIFTIHGCNRPKTHEELIELFVQNKSDLDSLVINLKSDKRLDSLFYIGSDKGLPNIKSSYPHIYDMLKRIGITDASSHTCNKINNWYYLKTNWPDKFPIYLIYTPCDSFRTAKIFYEKDIYRNEWWGLGENWLMFRFVKTIDYNKQ